MLSLVISDFHGSVEMLDPLEKMINESDLDVIFFCCLLYTSDAADE